MKANELYNLSISPLVTSNFALEWSEDNHITLITHRGVHVFEFIPHPMCIYPTLKFWRTFIYPSEFVPAELFRSFVNTSLWQMSREDILTNLMDQAVTPKIEEKTDIVPRIVKVAWSPIKLVEPSKCLLAVVTSAGSIELLYKLGSNWLSIWNLTRQWSGHIAEETSIDPDNLTESSFANTSWREHIRRLLGTAVAWSPLILRPDDSPFAYIVSAYRSSDLVISRVEQISDLAKCAKECNMLYKTCLQSDVKITQLLWLCLEDEKHVIFICYADGRIHGILLAETNGTLRQEKLFKYYDYADRILPNSIRLLKKTQNGNSIILVTKSSCIVALSVDQVGDCVQTRYFRVPGFSITGLTTISSDKVIVTTQNHQIYSLIIGDTEELSCEMMSHDLKTSKVQYLGLASSPNSTILLNVTSPDATHDHLINREPSTLQIFSLLEEEWDPRRIIDDAKNENISLYNYWDCLEAIRIKASRGRETDKLTYEVPKNLNRFSIHKLRIVMWLTLISEVVEKKQILKGVDKIVGEISEAQPLIFLLSACEHLARLAKKTNIHDDDKRCISFLRMYMEIYIAGENEEELKSSRVSKRVAEVLAASSHIDSIETESCNLCGEIITELPWTVECCSSGHKLPRCSITLLQITSLQYRVCPVCGRIFHPSLDDEYGETRCLYCDVPAQHDSRIVSSKIGNVETRWKNLSKRPASYLTESKAQESENSNATEKVKRKGINPHTFAVIVNKDDDDSCITETWQEF